MMEVKGKGEEVRGAAFFYKSEHLKMGGEQTPRYESNNNQPYKHVKDTAAFT